MFVYKVNEVKFKYLTKASGHTLQDVADLLGISLSSLYQRLNGNRPFKFLEGALWANFVGCDDILSVFYEQVDINA